MSADAFGNNNEQALPAALGIEIFHNFTLIHDDIMDAAPLRRGMPTVHHKWNVNTGILSGDAMLIKAYQCFESYPPEIYKRLMSLFSKTALEVCEGQQWDIEFEKQTDVSMLDYIRMIQYKTAVLVAAALKMGAIIGGASEKDQDNIYAFGINLGIAFQLLDDYLDAFGNPETFGKQVGGDIIENKKTYIYIKALELATEKDKEHLLKLYQSNHTENTNKIENVKQLFVNTGAVDAIMSEINNYTALSFKHIKETSLSEKNKSVFIDFGEQLMNREV